MQTVLVQASEIHKMVVIFLTFDRFNTLEKKEWMINDTTEVRD